MKTYVVADIGANHDRSVPLMFKAIEAAKAAGADAIKFQWTSDPHAMAARRGSAAQDGYGAVYQKYLAWPESLHVVLADECRARQIDYMCTTFLPRDVERVAAHVARFKVASFEARDREMLLAASVAAGFHQKDLIVSCGMQDGCESRDVFDALPLANRPRICWMHCISSYPTPDEQLDIAVLRNPLWSGYSDHSTNLFTGALAAAAGAVVIEKHLRLRETSRENPDCPHALDVDEFANYVANIRRAERMLGDGVKRRRACEGEMEKYAVIR